ncbi:putative ATP-dependent RNA helicase prh1 [Leucoagaricus sp. SymC.cos]|nr:putative ATP-dependent RNA helicase prh1 [Leucoagaricus sp. SymC.cos]
MNGHSFKNHKNKHDRGPTTSSVNGVAEGSQSKKSGSTSLASAQLQEQRKQLPIAKGRDALIEEIGKHDVTVLLGETGSGKTTQVPQYLLERGLAGKGTIAVTQPRRVAATSLADRVAKEQGISVGDVVGYAVRFDEKYTPSTRIKYMTDGMIVRELMSDPLLSKYSVVIVDEAHERTLRTDLLLANLKNIQRQRNNASDPKGKGNSDKLNPLKIVIMSATLDAEKFSRFFHNAKIIYVKGRQHPVTIYHSAQSQVDYVDAAMRTFFQVHLDQPPGDVLIFLPGQEDIESLEKSIAFFAKRLPADKMDVLVLTMYASQSPTSNAKAFESAPPNTRKCILATNIAETSITIPGVKYVIDTGKCKEKQYLARDSGGGFDTLLTRDITKSSAMQRAGRAGREGKGVCFRLYTEEAFESMNQTAEPEILRCSLTSSILQLKCIGQNMEELDLMDKPEIDSIYSALKTLWLLGAIDKDQKLTPIGRQMASFPIEPHLSRSILASTEHACTKEILIIVSVLSSSSKLFLDISDQREAASDARRKFRHSSGDHMTILNAVRAYEEIVKNESKSQRKEWCKKHFINERALTESKKIREQLADVCKKVGLDPEVSSGENEDPVITSLGYGLVGNSAFLQQDGTYKQTMGHSIIKIHPGSTMMNVKIPAIIYDELVYTNQVYARGVSAIRRSFFVKHVALSQRQA